jgi:hypothetical protein
MVAILAAGAAASPPDVPGWVHGAAATGAVAIGMGETGAVAIGMGETGAVAIGITGTGIIITITMMSSSLAASAFQGGGAGAGAGDIQDITATGIRTAITGMVILTVTGMDTVATATVTAMDMATAQAANTALPLGRE